MANGDPDPGSAENLAIMERRGRAVELRKEGKTYRAIAAALEVSVKTAHSDVLAELQRLNTENREEVAEVRRLELERLESLFEKSYAKLDNATVSYPPLLQGIIRLSERKSKLLGLDAPTRQEFSGPNGGPMELQQIGRAAALVAEFKKQFQVDDAEAIEFLARDFPEVRELVAGKGETQAEAARIVRLLDVADEHIPQEPFIDHAALPEPEMPEGFQIETLFQVEGE